MESTDGGRKEMKPSEASKKLEFHSKQICHGCMHPSMVGWCENHCQLPEAFKMAISALEFKERYDQFWEEVKTAGKKGKETEIHHSGRVFRIREVAQ